MLRRLLLIGVATGLISGLSLGEAYARKNCRAFEEYTHSCFDACRRGQKLGLSSEKIDNDLDKEHARVKREVRCYYMCRRKWNRYAKKTGCDGSETVRKPGKDKAK